VVPSVIPYLRLPTGFSLQDPANTDSLEFEGTALGEKTITGIKVRAYAQAQGFDLVVKADDGYIVARSMAFRGEWAYGYDRCFKAIQPESLPPLLMELDKILKLERVKVSRTNIGNLVKNVFSLTKVPEPAIEGLTNILKEMADDPEKVAKWLVEVDLPQGYDALKNNTLSIFDAVVSASLSTVELMELIGSLESSHLNNEQQKTVLVSHPDFAIPYPANKRDSYVDHGGQPAVKKEIKDLVSNDSVLCTEKYVTKAGINPLAPSTLVYTTPIYSLVPKKGSQEKVKADKPTADKLISSDVFKYVVKLNAKDGKAKATGTLSVISGSSSAPVELMEMDE